MEYGLEVSSLPRLALFSSNCTPATPTLSAALALTVTVPLTEAPLAGAVMDTVGAVVSGAGTAGAGLAVLPLEAPRLTLGPPVLITLTGGLSTIRVTVEVA